MERTIIREIISVIEKAKKILIVSHINPDGDTLGSSLALYLALKKTYKNVLIVSSDPVPDMFKFLPAADSIIINPDVNDNSLKDIDVAITVECPTFDRVGRIEKVIKNIRTIINIDHHLGNGYYGKINYVDTNASAVGEQVFKLINKLSCGIDSDIATCLYVSILTDTGSFSYSNTTSETHKIVAELLKFGLDIFKINNLIYENNSAGKLKLLSKVLNSISMSKDCRVSWIILTKEMLKETSTLDNEADGFVNYPRSIKGVEVSILFRETDDGKIRVSLRSNGKINVNEIAVKFNGGGHERAAGCTISGDLKIIQDLVLKEVSLKLS